VLGDREFDDQGTVMAAEYLYRRYTQLGFKVHYADFTGPDGSHQLNVVADPPASASTPQALMITGHYDSISPPGQVAPGADDNASGIASMLELAARSAKASFTPAITFVAFAAEEPGLYGSASYTQQIAARGVKLKAVINLDAVGIDNKGIVYVNGNSDSRSIYKDLVALSSDAYWLEWMSSNYFLSDDEHFRRAGYPAVMVTTHPWGTEPRHHTPQDTVQNLDMGMIKDLTDMVWSWFQRQS
jgi:Zn-dependent M28 family amino/carboxypeptidase